MATAYQQRSDRVLLTPIASLLVIPDTTGTADMVGRKPQTRAALLRQIQTMVAMAHRQLEATNLQADLTNTVAGIRMVRVTHLPTVSLVPPAGVVRAALALVSLQLEAMAIRTLITPPPQVVTATGTRNLQEGHGTMGITAMEAQGT